MPPILVGPPVGSPVGPLELGREGRLVTGRDYHRCAVRLEGRPENRHDDEPHQGHWAKQGPVLRQACESPLHQSPGTSCGADAGAPAPAGEAGLHSISASRAASRARHTLGGENGSPSFVGRAAVRTEHVHLSRATTTMADETHAEVDAGDASAGTVHGLMHFLRIVRYRKSVIIASLFVATSRLGSWSTSESVLRSAWLPSTATAR